MCCVLLWFIFFMGKHEIYGFAFCTQFRLFIRILVLSTKSACAIVIQKYKLDTFFILVWHYFYHIIDYRLLHIIQYFTDYLFISCTYRSNNLSLDTFYVRGGYYKSRLSKNVELLSNSRNSTLVSIES